MIAVCNRTVENYRRQIDVTLGIPRRDPADRRGAMMALKDRV